MITRVKDDKLMRSVMSKIIALLAAFQIDSYYTVIGYQVTDQVSQHFQLFGGITHALASFSQRKT